MITDDLETTTQEGPVSESGGESLRASARSPAYSGGGTNRLDSLGYRNRRERAEEKKKEALERRRSRRVGKDSVQRSQSLSRTRRSSIVLGVSEAQASGGPTQSCESLDGSRLWQQAGSKRQRTDAGEVDLSDEDLPAVVLTTAPNTGALSMEGRARRRQYLAQQRDVARSELEGELVDREQRSQGSLPILDLVAAYHGGDERLVSELGRKALEDVGTITMVAAKSGNLKGVFQRALKDSATSLRAIVEALSKRTSTEETDRLKAANARLEQEVVDLRNDMGQLRSELRKLRAAPVSLPPRQVPDKEVAGTVAGPASAPAPDGELLRSVMLSVGSMVNTRLASIEDRLLPERRVRPPLAADRVRAAAVDIPSKPPTGGQKGKRTPGVPVKGKSREVQTAKGVPKQADSRPPARRTPAQPEQARTLPPPPESMDEGWSTVVKRKRRKKKGKGAPKQAPVPSKKPRDQQAKLRSPRSSAVVITLQPQALKEGVTYAKVLTQLKSKIDLASCGIEGAGLQCRQTATGARKLEVSGATSGGKADSLAKMIRQVIGPDTLQVSRPIKCAEMRISGLDDSVSGDELAAVIAQRGGCPVEAVKVGEIRLAAQGAGFAWVRCPVEAAKKIREGGRLLVGWVSARVTVLEARPMQCYRCMQKGHVRAQCAAEVDRSDACYRCGKPGHKAAQCTAAAPKCMLCAAGGKPAEHRMGGKACSPPKPKKTVKAVARPSNAAPLSQGPEGMEITTIVD